MSEGRAAPTAAHRVGSGAGRLKRAWRNLPHERRLAAYAAIGLFLTLFLPWYQETGFVANASKTPQPASQSLNGWAAFSFVEAAVLLVAVGVLTLLFRRAEGRAFHLPGGDGWAIMAAGAWTSVLVVWRIFDKQGTSSHGLFVSSSGIEWGIFVALGVAVFLAYAGSRVRAAHQPEPPLPGEDGPRSPPPSPGEWDSARSPSEGEGGSRARSPSEGEGGSRARSPSPAEGEGGSRSRSRSPSPSPSPDGPRSPASAEDAPHSWSAGGDGPPSWSPGKDDPPSWSPGEDDPGTPEWPPVRRPVGWLSAPAGDRDSSPRPEQPLGEPRPEGALGEPGPEEPRGEHRPFRAPKPYPTGEAPAPPPVLPPSTPAARSARKPPDEQLTIPLEHED